MNTANFRLIGLRVALMLSGILFAFALVFIVLNLFPGLQPDAVRDPLETRRTNETMDVVYTEADGDLFYHMAGNVRPVENPQTLSTHTVEWDSNGFRVPVLGYEDYDDYKIVALGDSFTDAWMVSTPWPDVLAERLETPVLNLAYQGYGPLEEASVMQDYGRGEREWILIGYFEGNDLNNAHSSHYRRENEGNLLVNIVREAVDNDTPEGVTNPDGNYRYPLALYIGANFYELAFFDSYIWMLNAERAVYEQSRNVEVLREALTDIQEAADGACVGLVYMPTKAHIYFQYAEPFGRRWIIENASSSYLDDENWIRQTEEAVEFETLLSRLSNQRDVIREVAAEYGIEFIDLTPAFEQAAGQGDMLYLAYDTHWNQAGHVLAGETVADYVEEGCSDS